MWHFFSYLRVLPSPFDNVYINNSSFHNYNTRTKHFFLNQPYIRTKLSHSQIRSTLPPDATVTQSIQSLKTKLEKLSKTTIQFHHNPYCCYWCCFEFVSFFILSLFLFVFFILLCFLRKGSGSKGSHIWFLYKPLLLCPHLFIFVLLIYQFSYCASTLWFASI